MSVYINICICVIHTQIHTKIKRKGDYREYFYTLTKLKVESVWVLLRTVSPVFHNHRLESLSRYLPKDLLKTLEMKQSPKSKLLV